ncbi:DUF4293 domain-containing protein [Cyclobacteriaceae bacterium]|nr:DUF4293 domain-containing protein [Cyclobacteriaceae bacterium]
MIQRIQSILLFVAAVVTGLVSFLPLWSSVDGSVVFQQGTFGLAPVSNLLYVFILSLVTSLTMFVNIFLFNKRKRQMLITQLSGLLLAITIVLVYLFVPEQAGVEGTFTFFFWLYILALISNAVARIFIKKDEDLVKSADRFR